VRRAARRHPRLAAQPAFERQDPLPHRPQRPDVALCVDVLAPEGYGEIIGGSQRIADYDLLLKRIHDHKLPPEAFQWYLDLRRFGTMPHGGFGMGIERVVSWICGLDHLREAIP